MILTPRTFLSGSEHAVFGLVLATILTRQAATICIFLGAQVPPAEFIVFWAGAMVLRTPQLGVLLLCRPPMAFFAHHGLRILIAVLSALVGFICLVAKEVIRLQSTAAQLGVWASGIVSEAQLFDTAMGNDANSMLNHHLAGLLGLGFWASGIVSEAQLFDTAMGIYGLVEHGLRILIAVLLGLGAWLLDAWSLGGGDVRIVGHGWSITAMGSLFLVLAGWFHYHRSGRICLHCGGFDLSLASS